MSRAVSVDAAVEGLVDEAIVEKLIVQAGGVLGSVYGKNGKQGLKKQVAGFNRAASRTPWIVLVDLDAEHDCAPPLRQAWLPAPERHMCFRVAVRAAEAWLLADRESLAGFLSISERTIPGRPEELPDPKRALVELARNSRQRAIREDMIPRSDSGRRVGPAYVSRVIEYVRNDWRPDVAERGAESLRRARACLDQRIESLL